MLAREMCPWSLRTQSSQHRDKETKRKQKSVKVAFWLAPGESRPNAYDMWMLFPIYLFPSLQAASHEVILIAQHPGKVEISLRRGARTPLHKASGKSIDLPDRISHQQHLTTLKSLKTKAILAVFDMASFRLPTHYLSSQLPSYDAIHVNQLWSSAWPSVGDMGPAF